MKQNKYWFRQKKYGYGVVPSTWEGWLSLLIFALIVILEATLITHPSLFYGLLTITVLCLIGLSKAKTKDPWEWRWG